MIGWKREEEREREKERERASGILGQVDKRLLASSGLLLFLRSGRPPDKRPLLSASSLRSRVRSLFERR